MRNSVTLVICSIACVLAAPRLVGQDRRGSQYQGEIIYKGGSKATYTRIWSESFGDNYPHSKDVKDFGGTYHDLPRINLSGVSRFDFIAPTKEEQNYIDREHLAHRIRKVNVTFRDGEKREAVFIDVVLVKWEGPKDSGSLETPSIVALTVR